MTRSSLRLAASVFAAALATTPLASLAVTAPVPANGYHIYRVEFTDDNVHGDYAVADVGRFLLRYDKGGVINGFDRQGDGARNIVVDGSLDSDAVNLRFAGADMNGTLDHGKIVGSGFIGGSEVNFRATPDESAPRPNPLAPVR